MGESGIVNLGSDQGVKKGDRLISFKIEELRDGNVVLFRKEVEAGEIVIEDVNPDRSVGRFMGERPEKDWSVKTAAK